MFCKLDKIANICYTFILILNNRQHQNLETIMQNFLDLLSKILMVTGLMFFLLASIAFGTEIHLKYPDTTQVLLLAITNFVAAIAAKLHAKQ